MTYIMVLPEVIYTENKIVPRSNFRVGTTSRKITNKEISFSIGTWNVRTLRQAGRLKNLTSEMDKCELNVVGLSEVRWPGKGEIVSVNYTMLYSGGVKAEKGVAVVLRNDVNCLTKVKYYSDRLMFVKIRAKPDDMVLV
jgi:Endonuclease/Exonuclease/phosphatase family.